MLKLLLPDAARARCARQFAREQLPWLVAEGGRAGWPMVVSLGSPTERDAAAQPDAIREWTGAWTTWQASGQPGRVAWETRQWPRLGDQRLPVCLELDSADAFADIAGQGERWRRALSRHRRLCSTCRPLQGRPITQRIFDSLADYADLDFDRLVSLLAWVTEHPTSGLLLRQLPIAGLDTKWIEQRQGLVIDLMLNCVGPSQAAQTGRDLHALLGLTKTAARARLRLLDEGLRKQVGGVGDFEAPLDDLASLPIAPGLVLVVENLESGLALLPMPDTVALMKLGHAVNLLRSLPWMQSARVVVWGDVDTHGFAILNRVRSVFPQTESLLMDRDTLLSHRQLWVEESSPYNGPALERLTAAERQVFDGLVGGTWGARLRLEQERLPWPLVLKALSAMAQQPG